MPTLPYFSMVKLAANQKEITVSLRPRDKGIDMNFPRQFWNALGQPESIKLKLLNKKVVITTVG